MERRITKEVEINKIVFDENLYPRNSYNWQTGYDYSQSILAGAVFPRVTLASLNGQLILVDGKHRVEANKILKKEKIDAEIFIGWNKKKIYEEAVKRNMAHGRSLSPFEKRRIILKLREFEFKDNEISELVLIPADKINNFVGQRLINSITGEIIADSKVPLQEKQLVIKSAIQHIAGKSYMATQMNAIEEVQNPMYEHNQINLLEHTLNLLKAGLFDLKNERVIELLTEIKTHLSFINLMARE